MSSADNGALGSDPANQTEASGAAETTTPPAEAASAGEQALAPQLPPGNLSQPPQEAATDTLEKLTETVDSEEKLNAVAQLKAAIQQSLQKKIPKPNTDALLDLCLCLNHRGLEDSVCKDLAKLLTESVGDKVLVPLMGVKRKQAAIVPKQAEEKKYVGRVKSYNTRKGFGFIDGGGAHGDIFVYNNRLVGRIGLIAGEIVEFEIVYWEGRPQARAVRVLDPSTNPVLSFDRQSPSEMQDQANVARNPLNAMRQAMMQPSTDSRAREMALAAAAAASEVPTKMPQAKTPNLEEKIREAQTAAAGGKRQPMPKAEREQNYPFSDWHAPSATGHSAPMQRTVPSTGFDSATNFADEGNIPRGATIRVTNFPATDVNNQSGTVQGYDAATARYAVLVQMQKPNEGGSETVPLQLREEYLIVTQLPNVSGARGQGRGAAASGGANACAAPLPVTNSSSALKRSAEDALRRFNLVPAPAPASGQSGMPAGMKGGGNFMPGMPGGGKGGPMGQMPAQRTPGQMPAAQNRMPTAMDVPKQPMPGANPMQPRPGGPAMQPAPKAGPSTGMRLEQYARPAAAMGPATPVAPQQSGMPGGPAMGMPGAPQAHAARPPLVQAGQLGGAQPQPVPKAAAAGGERKPSVPEGRPGAVWRVLQSKEFQDVIIRETQEVTSPLMDRIKPGETCIQRGETVELLSGLVRMPIEPRGWVTVHARLIGGPTFMAEQPAGGAAAAAPRSIAPLVNAPPPAAVPKAAFSQGADGRLPLIPGQGSSVQPQPKAMAPPPQKQLSGPTGPAYKKDQMLKFQQVCRRTQQAPRDVLRTLRMPGFEGAAPPERERKHHRGDKERKREQKEPKADHGPEGEDQRSPQRERRDESGPVPKGPLAAPPAARPKPAASRPGASGEEKKADCPTQ